ncbi:DinB family protein [Ferruginibacter sp. SUN106]|uniref:DinB family protein n=1 Tax=Ferruginibacter sp. SUN106 TaxID=2978348 RepID=UPI003D364951
METANQLANRFKEVFLDGKWVANTNYKEQLSNLTWQQAVKKNGSLNTIAALTFHINYYIAGVLHVLEGGALEIRDKYSFNMPPVQSQQDWENLLHTMWANAEKFARQVAAMSEEALEQTFTDEKYGSYRRNIEAIIEHSYYHLGQITLLKKIILTVPSA